MTNNNNNLNSVKSFIFNLLLEVAIRDYGSVFDDTYSLLTQTQTWHESKPWWMHDPTFAKKHKNLRGGRGRLISKPGNSKILSGEPCSGLHVASNPGESIDTPSHSENEFELFQQNEILIPWRAIFWKFLTINPVIFMWESPTQSPPFPCRLPARISPAFWDASS